jgi:prevent-host-death family protein
MYDSATSTVTVSEARAALPHLLDRVAAGDEVTITRHGRPVAVVVRPDALRARRAAAAMQGAAKVRDVLAAGRAAKLPPARGVSEARAEELIADVRAGRERA